MQTLREIRTQRKVTLNEIAKATGIDFALVSKYEKNLSKVMLEDALLIEKYFGTRIKWSNEPTNKDEILQNLFVLYQNYPMSSVSSFASRMAKQREELLQKGVEYSADLAIQIEDIESIQTKNRENMENNEEVEPLMAGYYEKPSFDVIKREIQDAIEAHCTDVVQFELMKVEESGTLQYSKTSGGNTIILVTSWLYTDYGLYIDYIRAHQVVQANKHL